MITSEIIGKLGGGSITKVMNFQNESLTTWTELLSSEEIAEDSIVVINLEWRGSNRAPELRIDTRQVDDLKWGKDYMEDGAFGGWLKAGSTLSMRSFNGSTGGAYRVNATLYITYSPAEIEVS